jgi:uncharacterized protein (TIGR03435 family)
MAQCLGKRPVERHILITLGWLALAAPALAGQQQASTGAVPVTTETGPIASTVYDVASIRKFTPDGGPMVMSTRFDPDGMTATHVYVKMLICWAYGVTNYQVSGGPAWLDSDLYDVHAKMDETTAEMLAKLPSDQAKQDRQHMAQALLADRFKLAVHHEARQLPGFALVVAKGGSKLHEAKPDDEYKDGIKNTDGRALGKGMMRTGLDGGAVTWTAQGISVDALAKRLSVQLRSKVDNETGLKDDYDVTLRFSIDEGRAAAPNPSDDGGSLAENSAPPIFTALQEQLGLKLESKKIPVDVIVIDHIEAPTEN